MPWSGQSFQQRHNHSLSREEADHAARIANAILRGGAPERIAIAVANKLAEHRQKRAAGGGVGALSYLAGAAGSPVNTAALPRWTPQQPASTGILPSGLMATPQVGSYMLDPTTGALSGASQQALQALGQRGLSIGAPGAAGAGTGGQTPYSAGLGGNQVNGGGEMAGGSTAGDGGASAAPGVDKSGFGSGSGLSFGDVRGRDVLTGAGVGALTGAAGGPPGMVAGALMGGAGAAAKDFFGGMSTGNTGLVGADLSGGDPNEVSGSSADLEGPSKRGGAIKVARRAAGGAAGISPSMASPWWTRSEARADEHPSGLVNSPVGGRSDHLPMSVPHGSYVMPADVISGMGQGNTLAGAHAFDSMVKGGPFGTKLPMPKLGGTLPKPPVAPRMVAAHHFSRGGRAKGHIPIIVAGGERIISPEEVAQLAGGDIKKGHEMLDRFVIECRKHVIDTTKKLPGPVR